MRSPALGIFAGLMAALACISAPVAHGQSPEEAGAKVVYHNDFTAAVGDEWSHKTTSVTPAGNRPFLGQFVEDPVTLKLKDLPDHKLLRVTFDLYLIRCWDGSSQAWGVKIWEFSLLDGPKLIRSTFSNAGFFSDNNEQSFPDQYPCKPYPAWTGAAERQTLGYIQSWGGPERTFDTDSVYHFSLAFPHSDKSAVLRFTSFMEKAKDKGWGLANLKIETLDAFPKRDDLALGTMWDQLASEDPVRAFAATWSLIESGDQAVPFIAKKMGSKTDDTVIDKLIADLDSDDYNVRQHATTILTQMRTKAMPQMRTALATTTSGEARYRLNEIIKDPNDDNQNVEDMRIIRAAHVLEVINTPAALQLRKTLGPLTQDKPAPSGAADGSSTDDNTVQPAP